MYARIDNIWHSPHDGPCWLAFSAAEWRFNKIRAPTSIATEVGIYNHLGMPILNQSENKTITLYILHRLEET